VQLLSVRQPWAWAIARGRKPVENRNWAPSYRGKLAIYASMHVDLQACESPLTWSAGWDPGDPVAAIGGIVAVVTLADVCSAAISGKSCDCGEWARPKAHHWRLTDPQPLTRPVVSIGRSARMADVIPMRIVAPSGLSGLSAEETQADQYGLWEPEPAVIAEVTAGLA
jgi:ASCH domain